jgi:hypothetical protein
MEKVTTFQTVHPHAAGMDVGAEKIFVSPDGTEVVSFDTFTSGYCKCIEYLQQKDITEVAMEATGVYWIALYGMLESCGFSVWLVNPKETKQVKGRKTDVKPACRQRQGLPVDTEIIQRRHFKAELYTAAAIYGDPADGQRKDGYHRNG